MQLSREDELFSSCVTFSDTRAVFGATVPTGSLSCPAESALYTPTGPLGVSLWPPPLGGISSPH